MLSALFLAAALVAAASSQESYDITGTNPPSGSCFCMSHATVNVRDTPCGNIIGTAGSPSCYTSKGGKQSCILSGVMYEFFSFDFDGRTGWAAGDYINLGSASACSGSADTYTCNVPTSEYGKRIHETTSPTPYDCVDSGCGNTCQGGQCVALVTCRCTRNGQWAPGTNCWSPGAKVVNNGVCNTNIAANTAIATFNSLGNYYAGHAAVFLRCSGNNVVVVDQWCCSSIGETTYSSSSSLYNDFYVVKNTECADRASWSCRLQNGGATCCDTSEPACLNKQHWWYPQ
jgi:hypothetical protein